MLVKNWLVGIVLVVMLGLIAGCGTPPAAPQTGGSAPEGGSLAGSSWELSMLQGQPLVPGTHISLVFEDDAQLGGFAGCNSYGGPYQSSAQGGFTPGNMASTQMACMEPAGAMEQEGAYLQALSAATSYRIVGERLELLAADGTVLLAFEPSAPVSMEPGELVGTAWSLVSLNGTPPVSGTTLTLAFVNEDTAIGSAGCRSFLFSYQGNAQRLSFPTQAMLGPDDCLANEAIHQQEGAYTDAFSWASGYRLEGEQLELLTSRGETLLFSPLDDTAAAPLEGTPWLLHALVEQAPTGEESVASSALPIVPLAGHPVTALFEAGAVNGSAGCNQYGASYTVAEEGLTITAPAATRMACMEPEGLMAQEQRFLGQLERTQRAVRVGDLLWLVGQEGGGLLFAAER